MMHKDPALWNVIKILCHEKCYEGMSLIANTSVKTNFHS